MCGIFGIISNKSDNFNRLKIAKQLFLLSESRGKEASGFAFIKENDIIVHKSPLSASQLIKTKEYKNTFIDNREDFAFIAHSRLVTNGYEYDNKNNQPFIKKNIVGIHNGIIVNVDELWLKYGIENKTSDLDSEIIPEILRSKLNSKKNINESLNEFYSEIYGMTNIALFFSLYFQFYQIQIYLHLLKS